MDTIQKLEELYEKETGTKPFRIVVQAEPPIEYVQHKFMTDCMNALVAFSGITARTILMHTRKTKLVYARALFVHQCFMKGISPASIHRFLKREYNYSHDRTTMYASIQFMKKKLKASEMLAISMVKDFTAFTTAFQKNAEVRYTGDVWQSFPVVDYKHLHNNSHIKVVILDISEKRTQEFESKRQAASKLNITRTKLTHAVVGSIVDQRYKILRYEPGRQAS